MELSENEVETLYADVNVPYKKQAPLDPKDRVVLERQARKKHSVRKEVSRNKSR